MPRNNPKSLKSYTAADLAREDELDPTEEEMVDDDEQAERHDRKRDEADDNYQPSSQPSASSEEYYQSTSDEGMDGDDRMTIRGVSRDEIVDQSMVQDEDEDEDEDENSFPNALSGATLRKLAEARDAFFDKALTGDTAKFLAGVRPFTKLSCKQLEAAYHIISNTEWLFDGTPSNKDIRDTAEKMWAEAIQGRLAKD
ncbi:hypothetical protein OH76DRAFT_1477477 [Lentinus brumalis]|uniref:Uncharacterized protein n=1 Tax=Lentinus brumalis TaxID=2498619 RepID=A0A371DT86_9APHY|nr:hypothetical protein OH76DRAFT_1477477 [Polyporus brumalis]